MKAKPIKDFPISHALVITGLCVAALIFCDWNQTAYGTGGKTSNVDPCNRNRAGGNSLVMRKAPQSEQPNILLIGIDTLRADHVGCFGYDKDTTPTMNRLAREGTLCTNAMSTSGWTLPSVMSVMTSLYPGAHQTYTYKTRLPVEATTLAEILKTNGYTTVGFVSNPLLDGRYGFSDGFDLYDDFTVSLDAGMDMFAIHNETLNDQQLVGTGELVTRTAVQWLQRNRDEQFFMFVFYIDPHYDYIPPAPFDTMFDPGYEGEIDGRGINKEPRHSQRPSERDLQHLLALYDGEVRYTDDCVAELLRSFAGLGVLRSTVIVLFGDHGDEFYEHGKTAHDRTLYDEIIHIPMIFWWPGRFPAGKRINALTSQVDIMPTILDYLGVSFGGPVQGASLRPLIEGRAEKLHETVWAELNTWIHVQAVVGDHYKLIHNVNYETWELYGLREDPHEWTNLFDQPAASGMQFALKTEWERWTMENSALAGIIPDGGRIDKVQLNEKQLQRLRALGYAQ